VTAVFAFGSGRLPEFQQINTRGTALAWARFDDQYHKNPKVLSVPPAARWLHAASVTHSRLGRSTTGFLTILEAEGLAVAQSVNRRAITQLADAGLWDRTDGGYLVHDYPDYLPESSKERTQAWRDRLSRDGHGDGGVTVTESHKPVSRATGIPNPNPNPVPRERVAKATPKIDPYAEGVDRVFAAFLKGTKRSASTMLTPERRKHVHARLAQGYEEARVIRAAVGIMRDPWFVEHHKTDLTDSLRSGSTLERFAQLEEEAAPVYRHPTPLTAAERGGEPARVTAADFAGFTA
jgi:hypothetical protein